MSFVSSIKFTQGLLILGSLTAALIGFITLCVAAGTELPIQETSAIFSLAALVGTIVVALCILPKPEDDSRMQEAMPISILAAIGTVMALTTAYQLVNYIRLPADLISFAESPFVNDILKLRQGVPIYTSPGNNNSYVYTPGTQILTYFISLGFGNGDSIPFYRAVQFSYVILACIVATSLSDLLARKFLSAVEYRHRLLWMAVWLPMFFLFATEPRVNKYTHSLHNDGLALLLGISAFWLIIKHSMSPRPWILALMTVLPAAGFMVKQSQVAWGGIFFIYLLASENVSWRQLLCYSICSAMLVAATIGVCYLLWADPFLFWTFAALGNKSVSILRSVLHLLQAGMYAIMGLLGGWVLVLRGGSRTSKALWICWLLIFGIEVYTSGFAWHANHLGPGIMIGACWFFAAIVRLWPVAEQSQSRWDYMTKAASAVTAIVLLLGGLSLVRIPRNPVPSDFFRYIDDIEKEFVGFSAEKVLMDTGNWIYLREKVLMKDRSESVALWLGKNQEISHALLAETIKRIQEKTYDKILARQLDTDQSWYDFQDRGSGVKAAILENYHPIGRVPAVKGVETWWPEHLLAEILVLAPNRSNDPSPVS
jgi:hypothetical protein